MQVLYGGFLCFRPSHHHVFCRFYMALFVLAGTPFLEERHNFMYFLDMSGWPKHEQDHVLFNVLGQVALLILQSPFRFFYSGLGRPLYQVSL